MSSVHFHPTWRCWRCNRGSEGAVRGFNPKVLVFRTYGMIPYEGTLFRLFSSVPSEDRASFRRF
jgi:hypothetical protein